MELIPHIAIFGGAIAALWFFAGLIVESIDRVANRFHNNGFIVAFFLLGFLTSLGEISVAINSIASDVPQVAVGNLVGASFVLLMFVIPLLAVAANGIRMNKVFDGWRLMYMLFVIGAPLLFLVDGSLTKEEGVATLLFLVSLFWIMKKYGITKETTKTIISENERLPLLDITKVIVAAIVIFISGHLLVKEAIYFADVFNAPQSLIGLLLLSVGTNIPEIAIAIRSVLKNRSEVALGNYLGSATINTVLFSIVAIISGPLLVNKVEFVISSIFVAIGFSVFYIFIRSKELLSRKEGIILLILYLLFIATHIYTFI